jgi:hypothetical protein
MLDSRTSKSLCSIIWSYAAAMQRTAYVGLFIWALKDIFFVCHSECQRVCLGYASCGSLLATFNWNRTESLMHQSLSSVLECVGQMRVAIHASNNTQARLYNTETLCEEMGC